jgi:hypothetical protein
MPGRQRLAIPRSSPRATRGHTHDAEDPADAGAPSRQWIASHTAPIRAPARVARARSARVVGGVREGWSAGGGA